LNPRRGQWLSSSQRPDFFWGPPIPLFNGYGRGVFVTPREIQPGPEADHSPPSRVKIKNGWRLSPQGDVHLSEIKTKIL